MKSSKKVLKKNGEKESKKPKKIHYKYDAGSNKINNAKKDFTKYLPAIVLSAARLNMFILAYMYHSQVSFINVMWVLLTFMIPDEFVLLLSSVTMVPILTWEFVLIYGSRIPVVSDTYFFKTFGKYFLWKFCYPVLEQSFMYINLLTFYMMISCYHMLSQRGDKENSLIHFFKKRVSDPRFSSNWKLVFFSMRYI
jgi:hypothetical protein